MLAISTAHAGGLLALLLLFLLPIVLVYPLAERKGRPGWVYVLASLLIGWPIPLVAALIVRRREPVG